MVKHRLKIYLSARWGRKAEMVEVAKLLVSRDYEVTSSWLDGPIGPDDPSRWTEGARANLDDIGRAHLLLQYTDDPGSSFPGGGRHTELGLAYMLEKTCCIIGPRQQVFHCLPEILEFRHIGHFMEHCAPHVTVPQTRSK